MDAVVDALNQLEKSFGRINFETIDLPCTSNKIYSEEMGDDLSRRFFSFENPIERDSLPEIKAVCQRIERQLGDRVREYTFRTVNLDPGLLTPDNLVMASTHEYNYRIYISDGIFADMQLIWAHGQYTRLPWTNPDYCNDDAIDLFIRVRESFDLLVSEKSPLPGK